MFDLEQWMQKIKYLNSTFCQVESFKFSDRHLWSSAKACMPFRTKRGTWGKCNSYQQKVPISFLNVKRTLWLLYQVYMTHLIQAVIWSANHMAAVQDIKSCRYRSKASHQTFRLWGKMWSVTLTVALLMPERERF